MTVLLVSGSTRSGSTNTAVLRTAAHLHPRRTRLYDGLVGLPPFNPDHDDALLPAPAAALRQRLADSSAVLFCTPEYAGALPGAFKNLLDWTVGGVEMADMPCGFVNVSSVASPTGGAGAHAELTTVLSYLGAHVVQDACRTFPLARHDVGDDGLVLEPPFVTLLGEVLEALLAARPHETPTHPRKQ